MVVRMATFTIMKGMVSKVRKILHLDLDAFYCAVEEQRNPALMGKPFAVGGKPDQRGVVASCTYSARRYGIRSAMPMSQAVRLYPELIVVPANFRAYRETSRKVMDVLHDLTPFVEQLSIDEAFLDVTMHHDSAEAIARRLQARINETLDLPCSLGGATNKLVAKIANNIGKASLKSDNPPNSIHIIPAGEEAAFLAPLPIRELWGVGPKTAEKLNHLGILTIGQIATYPEESLVQRFGKIGRDLARHAKGIDTRDVQTEQEAKSISKEITFTRDVNDSETLKRTLRRLSDGVGAAGAEVEFTRQDNTTEITLAGFHDADTATYFGASHQSRRSDLPSGGATVGTELVGLPLYPVNWRGDEWL